MTLGGRTQCSAYTECQSHLELAGHLVNLSKASSCPVPVVCTKLGSTEWLRNVVPQPPVNQTPAEGAGPAAGPEGWI